MTGRLLDEIEQDVLGDRPLADALRKCVVLGGRAASTELRDWAAKELRGYGNEDELPGYRVVHAPILVDAVTGTAQVKGQRISPNALPEFAREHIGEEVRLYQGVGEIEALVKTAQSSTSSSVYLSIPMATELAAFMDKESGNSYQHTVNIYWSVASAPLSGVIDQIRSRLAELVAELRAGMPEGQDTPSRDLANQAVNVAIHGAKSRVTLTTAQSGAGPSTVIAPPSGDDPGFWTQSRKIGAFVVGVATVLVAILTALQFLA